MTLEALEKVAQAEQLAILGALHTEPADGLGDGTIALLGPSEPGFWPHVQDAPEFKDGAPDPMDRWSRRTITTMAEVAGGLPLFPFGSPARPFIGWALRSGQAFVSPASLLVHAEAGLLVSYRGAVLFQDRLDLPPTANNPCDSCAAKPCLSACPPRALTKAGYNLAACHQFLDAPEGHACMSQGCAVRRSCPLSRKYPRMPEQSAFHMKAFHS